MIVGLGNDFRRDDAAGLVAARRLRERGAHALEHHGDLASLIDRWTGAPAVILLDAVVSGAPPGTIHRLDAAASPLPRAIFKGSTHALGLADAVELSRALGSLPPRVVVFGIEVEDLSAGVGLSHDVERSLPVLVEEVLQCMNRP